MFSEEFMRYLINYQKPEYKEVKENATVPFKTGLTNKRLATILLTVKK